MLDLDIAVLRPAEGFQSLPKRDDTRKHFGVVLGVYVQERDASHALRLLRARRERPCRRRTAKERDKLAALHLITSSCFGVGMTRLINEQNIRTPQRIENRACNDPGILATDMKPISCGLPCMRVMCLEYSIRN
jgi:hypothetical protein